MGPRVLNAVKPEEKRAYSICLAMIVRNEAPVIARCLASVYHSVDAWAIVDTGSYDNTREIIQDFMQDKPGVLADRSWTDFSTARNQALELARGQGCDFIMVIDADETLENVDKSGLCHAISSYEADVYMIEVRSQGRKADRVFLVKSDYPGRWKGAIHEALELGGEWVRMGLAYIHSRDDGARHKSPTRVNDDLTLLFQAIQKEPKNPRNYYYLGATYWCAGAYEQAEKAFALRVKMGGDAEEIRRSFEYLKALEERRKHGKASE